MVEKRLFVVGDPISHSLSPVIMDYWLTRYNLPGNYQALRLTKDESNKFFNNLVGSDWFGGNVTVPHKETCLKSCNKLTEAAKVIGAVNTLWVSSGLLIGDNTDAIGFMKSLLQAKPDCLSDVSKRVLILGAGGAARAVIYALKKQGLKNIVVVNRTPKKAILLLSSLGIKGKGIGFDEAENYLKKADICINSTSVGMLGGPQLSLTEFVDLSKLSKGAVFFDLVYNPRKTPLMDIAQAQGCQVFGGLGMLINQASLSFSRWFNITPELDDVLLEIIYSRLNSGI